MRYILLLQSVSDYGKLFLTILSAVPHTSFLNFGSRGKGAKLAVFFSMWEKKNLEDPKSYFLGDGYQMVGINPGPYTC